MAVLALILVGAVVLVLVIAIVVMQMRRARMQAGAKKGGAKKAGAKAPKDDEDVVVLGAARPWRKHVHKPVPVPKHAHGHSRRGYRGRFPDRRVVLMSGKQERRLSRKVGSALSAGYEYDMAQDAVMSDMAHTVRSMEGKVKRLTTAGKPFSGHGHGHSGHGGHHALNRELGRMEEYGGSRSRSRSRSGSRSRSRSGSRKGRSRSGSRGVKARVVRAGQMKHRSGSGSHKGRSRSGSRGGRSRSRSRSGSREGRSRSRSGSRKGRSRSGSRGVKARAVRMSRRKMVPIVPLPGHGKHRKPVMKHRKHRPMHRPKQMKHRPKHMHHGQMHQGGHREFFRLEMEDLDDELRGVMQQLRQPATGATGATGATQNATGATQNTTQPGGMDQPELVPTVLPPVDVAERMRRMELDSSFNAVGGVADALGSSGATAPLTGLNARL